MACRALRLLSRARLGYDPRPGVTGHRLHDFGEAGDDRRATRGHEAHAGRHLGAHGARLEVTLGGVGLHLGEGHGAERLLHWGVVVLSLIHISEPTRLGMISY